MMLIETLVELFREGGIWMYPISLLDCGLVALSIVLLTIGISSKRRHALVFAAALIASGLVPPMLGELAHVLGMQEAEAAIARAHPADAAILRYGFQAESMSPLLFGLSGSVIPVFCGFALLGVGLGRLPRFEETT
jgi:hypothetical protein